MNVSTKILLDNLSEQEEIKLLSKIIGYESLPVDIKTFVLDDYYLGRVFESTLFPVWLDVLQEIYPDPIRTSSTFIIVKGAIGTGKSTFSKICTIYDMYKLTLIKDPHKFLKLDPTTQFTFRYFNINIQKAHTIFVNSIWSMLELSPYFKELFKDNNGNFNKPILLAPASRSQDVLSEALTSCVISEANFFKPWVVQDIIKTVISRLESRFQLGIGYINHIILDSSDTVSDSVIQNFILSSPYRNELKIYTLPIWEAKRHLNIYFKKTNIKTGLNYFYVYVGDNSIKPFIINDEEELKSNVILDRDKIVKVPEELRELAQIDIDTFLRDKAGISTVSGNQFFTNKSLLKDSFSLPLNHPEHIVVSFYDEQDTIMPYFIDTIRSLPKDRLLYCRLDLGVVNDNAGIAISYLDSMISKPLPDGGNIMLPIIHVPIAFSLGRHPGEETPINKIRDFFIELNSIREIKYVTTDQYQSTQLRQELQQHGIESYRLSVDSSNHSYNINKNLVNDKQVKYVNSTSLLDEMLGLQDFDGKIDHPIEGSKDISDAVVGAVSSCFDDGNKALVVPKIYSSKLSLDVLNDYARYKRIESITQKYSNKMLLGFTNKV